MNFVITSHNIFNTFLFNTKNQIKNTFCLNFWYLMIIDNKASRAFQIHIVLEKV